MRKKTAGLVLALLLIVSLLAAPSAAAADPGTAGPSEICQKVAVFNTVDAATGAYRPGPEYVDGTWLRDSFWVTGYLGQAAGRVALERFGSRLSAEGQAPTKIEADGVTVQLHNDESTLLYLIWAVRDGGQPTERLVKAWNWVAGHVDKGGYFTPPGPFHSWHDILAPKTWDVLAYNQGLYALAAQLMADAGIAYPDQAQAAVDYYRSMYRPLLGYLPVSANLDYHDVTVTVGEVLGRIHFGKKMLSDEVIQQTIRALSLGDYQPLANTGFKVLSKANGDYLEEDAFYPGSLAGRYQNGGSWLLYDTLAWTALGLAGDPAGYQMAAMRVLLESFWGTFFEYVSTGPAGKIDMLPQHPDYAWNAFVCKLVVK